MPRSKGEQLFLLHCVGYRLPEPMSEFRFATPRRYRFDFAFPEFKVAVEIEGGVYSRGRHTRGKGYEADLLKYNLATELGWSVYRFSTQMVEDGTAIRQIFRVLRSSGQVPDGKVLPSSTMESGLLDMDGGKKRQRLRKYQR